MDSKEVQSLAQVEERMRQSISEGLAAAEQYKSKLEWDKAMLSGKIDKIDAELAALHSRILVAARAKLEKMGISIDAPVEASGDYQSDQQKAKSPAAESAPTAKAPKAAVASSAKTQPAGT
jgi:hypothetical protein